ncbi:MAG TPA: cupin domain-containing protein [Bradyrhizobium sp.]
MLLSALNSTWFFKPQFNGSLLGPYLIPWHALSKVICDAMTAPAAIHIATPAEFDSGTAQTPGSERRAAIAPALGVASTIWGGLFEVNPGSRTGIHHHGEQETIAYVLSGICEIRWGAKGEYAARAKAGDFIHVPAFLPHMEINPSKDQPFRWVVVRSTATPIVVNLPDDTWP